MWLYLCVRSGFTAVLRFQTAGFQRELVSAAAAALAISQYVPVILCAGRTDSTDRQGGVDGKVCEAVDVPVSFKSDVWEHLSFPPPVGGTEEEEV